MNLMLSTGMLDAMTAENIIDLSYMKRCSRNLTNVTELLNIACSMRKYNNLTDDKTDNMIMSVNLERALMLTGFAALVKNPVTGKYYPLPFVPSTPPDLECRPTGGLCIGYDGRTFPITDKESPILKNTPWGWSIMPAVIDYAERIESIDTTAQTIINTMQVPYIIVVPDGDKDNVTGNVIANKIARKEPVIVTTSSIFEQTVKVFNTGVSGETLSHLNLYRSESFAQFMRKLGVSDMTGEKRERLLVSEVALSAQSSDYLSNCFEVARDENVQLLSDFLGRKVTWEENRNYIDYIQQPGAQKVIINESEVKENDNNLPNMD